MSDHPSCRLFSNTSVDTLVHLVLVLCLWSHTVMAQLPVLFISFLKMYKVSFSLLEKFLNIQKHIK